MIGKIWTIALSALVATFRNRGALVTLLLVPMILTFVVGQGESDTEINAQPTGWRIEVVNDDEGELGSQLIIYLKAIDVLLVSVEKTAVLQDLGERGTVAVLIIPPNFSESLISGELFPPELHVESLISGDSLLVQESIRTTLLQLQGSLDIAHFSVNTANQFGALSTEEKQLSYFNSAFNTAVQLWDTAPPIDIQVTSFNQSNESTNNAVPTGFNQSSPGFLVMFSLFFTIAGGTAALVGEREGGTLQRLLVMPMHKSVIVLGKFFGIYITGLFQVLLLIVGGVLFFNVPWATQPIALTLMVLSFLFATTSLSLLLAAFVRNGQQANAVSILAIIVMSALGGAWWPLEVVPSWMQTLGYTLPSAWAMSGFHDIITRGLGVENILLETAVLVGFGLLFLPVGIWRFRYQ